MGVSNYNTYPWKVAPCHTCVVRQWVCACYFWNLLVPVLPSFIPVKTLKYKVLCTLRCPKSFDFVVGLHRLRLHGLERTRSQTLRQ